LQHDLFFILFYFRIAFVKIILYFCFAYLEKNCLKEEK